MNLHKLADMQFIYNDKFHGSNNYQFSYWWRLQSIKYLDTITSNDKTYTEPLLNNELDILKYKENEINNINYDDCKLYPLLLQNDVLELNKYIKDIIYSNPLDNINIFIIDNSYICSNQINENIFNFISGHSNEIYIMIDTYIQTCEINYKIKYSNYSKYNNINYEHLESYYKFKEDLKNNVYPNAYLLEISHTISHNIMNEIELAVKPTKNKIYTISSLSFTNKVLNMENKYFNNEFNNLDDANNEYTKFTLGNRNDINDKFQSVVLEYINYRFNFNIKQLNLVTIVKRFMVSNDKKLQYYSKGLNEITGKGTPYRNMFIKCKFITNMLAL
jgi:hypothetical protein